MAQNIFQKNGLIAGELTWEKWQEMDPVRFASHVGDMLNFYNKNTAKSDLKKDLLEWMKNNGYSKKQISAVRSTYETEMPFTAAKIARALNIGMPESHPDISTHYQSTSGFLRKHIAVCVSSEKTPVSTSNEDSETPKPEKVSPIKRLQNKVETTVLHDLSVMMDNWIVQGDNKIEKIDIVKSVKEHEVPVKGLSIIQNWLQNWLSEVEAARDKTDSDLVEGYSYLNKRALNAWAKQINAMISDLNKYEIKEKTNRKNAQKSKSTQKKQTAAQLQKKVNKVQYQNDVEVSPSLFLASIAPLEILGSRVLYTYNTKYRRLSCFMAANHDGLTISGTTVKNFDPENSYTLTLRKPEETLKLFVNQSVKHSEIEKQVKTLKSKRSVPTGRINQNVVLLNNHKTV